MLPEPDLYTLVLVGMGVYRRHLHGWQLVNRAMQNTPELTWEQLYQLARSRKLAVKVLTVKEVGE